MTKLLISAKRRATVLLDRLSEKAVPQLVAGILAVLAVFEATSISLMTQRFYDTPEFSTAFFIMHPVAWGGLYAMAGLALFAGAVLDRAFTQGASLVLCAVHTMLGLFTIVPIAGGAGLPTVFSSYMGYAALCFVSYLMWRARKAKR